MIQRDHLVIPEESPSGRAAGHRLVEKQELGFNPSGFCCMARDFGTGYSSWWQQDVNFCSISEAETGFVG